MNIYFTTRLNFLRELCSVWRSADYRCYGSDWSVLCCAKTFHAGENWHVGIHLETRKYFFFACGIHFHTKNMPMWQSRKAFGFHKAIKNKHCCCAENFNWSCICPSLPRILKCVSVLVCVFAYTHRLHYLVLAPKRETRNSSTSIPFFAGCEGGWTFHLPPESTVTILDIYNDPKPAELVSWAGAAWCCLLFISFSFELAAAGRFLKETLCRMAPCLLYLHPLFCSLNPPWWGPSCTLASAGQGGTLPCQRATGHLPSPLH